MIDLSVCITTYNLENAISKTLETVFSQKTKYSFEVLIGDDGSSDNTLAVVNQWKEKYPDIISVYVMPREQGKKYNFIFRASANRLNLLDHAKGRYITFLDGDDFYIDDNKFEKQIDILERNQNCSMCAHNFNYYYEKTGEEKTALPTSMKECVIDGKTYWKTGLYTHAEAAIMRKDFLRGKVTDKYFDDNFINFLALQKGDCYYIPDVMVDYRQNENGYATWDKARCEILNLLDFDMEIKVNPAYKWASISRHWFNFKNLYPIRNKGLDKKFPELYKQAKAHNAKWTLKMMEGRFSAIDFIAKVVCGGFYKAFCLVIRKLKL